MAISNGDTLPVLVVGAGPVGLTMALDLTLRGIKCRVIDKLPAASDKSKALGVHARTLELLEMMGIIDEFLSIGHKVHGTCIFNHKTPLVKLCFDEVGGQYPYALMVPQNETERILAEQLAKHGVAIEREVELVDFSDGADAVSVNLKRLDGSEEALQTNWLLGCDGAHSTVRHKLGLTFDGGVYAEPFATIDCYVDWDKSDDELNGFVGEDGVVFFFPMGNQRYRIVADGPEGAISGDLSLEQMQEIVDKRCYPGIKLRNPNWLTWFTINHRSVTQYRKGHVFVSGDAAHVHSPMMGQGMNTGMQDAINLAWKIEMVEKGISHTALLDSYQEERHPVGQNLLRNTDAVTKVVTIRNHMAQAVRNKIMPLLAAQDVVQHRAWRLLSMLGINYRTSPIVGQYREVDYVTQHPMEDISAWLEFGHGPMPGDRALDGHLISANTSQPVRLHEKLHGINHNILLFAGLNDSSEALKSINDLLHKIEAAYEFVNCHAIVSKAESQNELKSAHSILIDQDGSVHHQYGAAHSCLYLIRPDGYIGFRSQPIEFAHLAKHFDKIFGALVKAKN